MDNKANEGQAETFPLLDLPFELIEQLVGYLTFDSLVHLSATSHQFKELASLGHYWQTLILRHKKKIICVSPEVTDWKEIFKNAVEYDNIKEALAFANSTNGYRLKMILSPGTYESNESLNMRPNCVIVGLWDTPYNQNTADRKSIIVFGQKYPLRFYPPSTSQKPEELTIFRNVTFTRNASTPQTWIVFKAQMVQIENCEFKSVSFGLQRRNAQYVLSKCIFDTTPKDCIAIACKAAGPITLQDCEFRNCDYGVNFDNCNDTKNIHLIEKCSFDGCGDAITFEASKGRAIIKNNKIINCRNAGIYLENNCAAEVIGCTIEKCRSGIMGFENSRILLQDNIIANNMEFGVRIRHGVEIQLLSGNRIQGNGTGIVMPLQDAADLSEEEILANNEISQNQINLVLEEKKTNVNTLYKEGDGDETMKKNVTLALPRNLCTYLATVTNYVEQVWYECFTCDMTVCPVCFKNCHEGHGVAFQSEFSECYCDCGAGSTCKSLH